MLIALVLAGSVTCQMPAPKPAAHKPHATHKTLPLATPTTCPAPVPIAAQPVPTGDIEPEAMPHVVMRYYALPGLDATCPVPPPPAVWYDWFTGPPNYTTAHPAPSRWPMHQLAPEIDAGSGIAALTVLGISLVLIGARRG